MKIVLLLIFVLSLAYAQESGKLKSQLLREMSKRTPIIELNETGYNYFIKSSPRPYDFVIFFTDQNSKYCQEIYDEYVIAAKLYIENGGLYPIKGEEDVKRAVFFGKMPYNMENQDLFRKQLKFNTLPNIIYYQPKFAQYEDVEEQLSFLKRFFWKISPTDGHVTSSKFLEFLNKRSFRNVEYKEPIINILFVIAIFAMIGMLGFYLYKKFQFVFLNPYVQFVGSMAIYVTCMSGVVFNIIHNVPFTGGVDDSGNVRWLQESDGRGQYGMEGALMSSSISLIGLLLLSLILFKKYFAHDSFNTKLFQILAMAGVFLLIKFCENIYRKKSWYSTAFYPPENYIKGPLQRDQGNSF